MFNLANTLVAFQFDLAPLTFACFAWGRLVFAMYLYAQKEELFIDCDE